MLHRVDDRDDARVLRDVDVLDGLAEVLAACRRLRLALSGLVLSVFPAMACDSFDVGEAYRKTRKPPRAATVCREWRRHPPLRAGVALEQSLFTLSHTRRQGTLFTRSRKFFRDVDAFDTNGSSVHYHRAR